MVDLSRALALVTGVEGAQPTPGAKRLADLIGPCDHLVFILADGLGMNFIEEMPKNAFLPSHLAAELRTIFPSATAVVLTSLATGEWPGQHAVTGWWTYLPEAGTVAAILPFMARSNGRPLSDLGVTARQAFPLPSFMGHLPRDTLAVLPELIADSVFSAYFVGNKARRGYWSFHEAVDIVLARVHSAKSPTYTYLYTPRVDGAAHRYGVRRPEVKEALLELDREVKRLHAGLKGRARIVLSADHGLLDAEETTKHQVKATDPLVGLLRAPPSGDARVLYLHVRDGAEKDVRKYFRERFGERFLLISIQDAEPIGLFGPGTLTPQARSRLGDLVAISQGRDVIEYRPAGGVGRILSEVSHHSGLTPAEMRVPLVIA